eukprot:3119740-Lingulodinium_polyedra.AAC.1
MFTDVSILPATRTWGRLMPYRLYNWDGSRRPWHHGDEATDGLRRLAHERREILQDDLAFAEAAVAPARSWVAR